MPVRKSAVTQFRTMTKSSLNDWKFTTIEAEKIMQKRINEYHMRNGVTMRNPESVYIEDGVEIGNDTEICQNVTIKR